MANDLSSGRGKKKMRCGVTTGASAAAAAKAAALLLFRGEIHGRVTVLNPQGIPIDVPIEKTELFPWGTRAVVIKDGGDDPDVTHGLEIAAELRPAPGGVSIRGGEGVGRVTTPGLPVPVGEPAINPAPARMIRGAVEPLLPPGMGVEVTISVPGGIEAAKRTLNQRLGIIGGLSILGTTGIVRPMSTEALRDSLVPFLKKAAALGFKSVVLTPGGAGYRQTVEDYGFPAGAVIEMSNYVGFMLEQCVESSIESVILWGHVGKMAKVAGGIFNTHSRVADGRREILAAYSALLGAKKELIAGILNINTLEGAVDLMEKSGLGRVFDHLAAKSSRRAEEYIWGKIKVGTVITARDGRILGMDDGAEKMGGLMGCKKLR